MDLTILELEYNGVAGQLSQSVRPDWLESLRRMQGQILEVMRNFEQESARLASNAELSDIGRASRRAQLAQYAADRLLKVQAEAEGIQGHIESWRRKATPPPPEGNEIVQFLREQEIRSRVDSQEQLTLGANLLAWAGDARRHEMVRAILNSPVPMVSEEVEAKAREIMAGVTSPEAAAAIRELTAVYTSVRAAVNSALVTLRANSLAPDDPVAVIARTGERNGEGA